MRMTLVLALGLWLISGLAFAQEKTKTAPPKPEPVKAEIEMVGSAQLVGSGHFPVLLFKNGEGKSFSLGGPLFEELKQIERITIRIWATDEGTQQEYPNLAVVRYEILDVGGGVKPFVGRVLVVDGTLRLTLLDSPVEYSLTGNKKVLAMLEKAAGGRVWIAGDVTGDKTLTIRKFGILTKKSE